MGRSRVGRSRAQGASSVNRCPPAEHLELLLAERLGAPERDAAVAHVEGCVPCQERLERLAAEPILTAAPPFAGSPPEPEPPEHFLCRLKNLTPPRAIPSGGETPDQSTATPGPDSADGLEGRRLGQYEILEQLGKGGMGVVYKAWHVELGKAVALKVLPAGSADEVRVARFKNEVRAMGRLDHPNVVTAHDAGQFEGVPFLVMAFVDGVDLARLLDRRGRLSIPDACAVVRQAALGLQHAFERGLVHRDVKPSNLMLARDGLVKVLDLGIARSLGDTPVAERLTAAGTVLGTADYLAPEQWDAPHAVDTRADVYGLGCTLYHMIAGQPPFAGPPYSSLLKKMKAHQEVPAPPVARHRPEVPARLAAVLDRMLAKNPADRFPTPGAVAEALRAFTAGSDLPALPGSDPKRDLNTIHKRGRGSDSLPRPRSGLAPQAVRPLLRRYARPLAVVTFCLALGAAVALGPKPWGVPPEEPLDVQALNVRQYRGENALPLGDVGTTAHVIRADDSVRVSVKLSAPAYCFLIAFNPDGTEQLCSPEDPDLPAVHYPEHKDRARAMAAPPARAAELSFPRDQFFEPGVPGLQVFVLVASAEPLPPYPEWRSSVGPVPWNPGEYRQPWRWHFDGQEFARLPAERGARVERGVPKGFKELCEFFRSRPRREAVRALAFPVSKE